MVGGITMFAPQPTYSWVAWLQEFYAMKFSAMQFVDGKKNPLGRSESYCLFGERSDPIALSLSYG